MAQQLRALTALAEAPGLVPEFTCQFIVSGNPTPSCGEPAPGMHVVHTDTCR